MLGEVNYINMNGIHKNKLTRPEEQENLMKEFQIIFMNFYKESFISIKFSYKLLLSTLWILVSNTKKSTLSYLPPMLSKIFIF